MQKNKKSSTHLSMLGMDFNLKMVIRASAGVPWMLPAKDKSMVQWSM